jgi:hypothetical protein
MKLFTTSIFIALLPFLSFSQERTGNISGTIADIITLKGIAFATVSIANGDNTVATDSLGRYRMVGVAPGSYTIVATAVGYKELTKYNIVVSTGNDNEVSFELQPESKVLDAVVVTSNNRQAKVATLATPLSVQRLTTEEIRAFPGGNFDISKVVQSLPGIGGGAPTGGGPRNDIELITYAVVMAPPTTTFFGFSQTFIRARPLSSFIS